MPVDPFQLNYDLANRASERGALYDALRQKATQGIIEQNTALAKNRADLMLGALQHLPNVRDTFGGVGAGQVLPQFGVSIPSGALNTPDSFTRIRDELALDEMKAGALAKMGEAFPADQGLLINPQSGEVSQFETPDVQVQRLKNAGENNKNKAPKVKVKRRLPDGREVEYDLPDEEAMTVINQGQASIEGAAPFTEQNKAPGTPDEQAALQGFDETVAMRGFEKVTNGLKQEDGSYLFDIRRRGDLSGQVYTYQVYPDGRPPQRVR